ncbi:hypothetical protein LCGC14_2067940 [marine sediment metagenome]|uniref:Uncharacterized protein n=1 Tax=marine sediment metagenome TaxID=412755 RepID=A0A0F9EJ58_9ZZZZ
MRTRLADPLRVCLDCGMGAIKEEDLKLFSKNKVSNYGRMNLCKKCDNERHRKYDDAHPEQVKERQKKHREANREKTRERNRKQYEANPEKHRERARKYREDYPEKVKEANRKWQKANPEKVRKYREVNREKRTEYGRLYFIANREKINEQCRKRYEKNPFKYRLYNIRERSNKNGLAFDLDLEYLKQLWNDCNGFCSMTGVPMLKKSDGNDPFVVCIDRIIPEKGYIKGNVRLVSLWYNTARSNWGDAFTLEMCQRVAERAYSPEMIEMLEAEGGK